MSVRLYADRFLMGCAPGTIDCASGAFVTLNRFEASVPGVPDAEWLARCGRLAVQRRPGAGALIDYGFSGPLDRFEAFTEPMPAGTARAERHRRPITLQPRRALEQLVEILDGDASGRLIPLTIVQLLGGHGSGLTTTLMLLAREARLRGYMPVSTSALARILNQRERRDLRQVVVAALALRSLVILHDELSDDRGLDAAVLGRSILTPEVLGATGGVVVAATHRLAPGLPVIRLDPMSKEAMVNMLGSYTRKLSPRAVRRALDDAAGRPGVFLSALGLQMERPMLALHPAHGAVVARERAEGYGSTLTPFVSGLIVREDEGRKWKKAERLLRDGRAQAERRGMRRAASTMGLQLGMLLLRRGRVNDAAAMFEEVMSGSTSAGVAVLAARAAACLGYAQTDAGQLHQAETVLRAARSVAARAGLNDERILLELALARCLYWQNRIDEAWILIEPLSEGGLSRPREAAAMYVRDGSPSMTMLLPGGDGVGFGHDFVDPAVLAGSVGVRVALAAAGPQRAMQIASNVFDRAVTLNRSLELALAHYSRGIVHAAVDDRAALAMDVTGAVASARQAGAPLLALRARVLLYETGNGPSEGRLPLRRLRYRPDSLPGLLAARVRLALAHDAAPDRAVQLRGTVDRWSRESGALRLRSDAAERGPTASVADVVAEVLTRLHDAGDETGGLEEIAADLGRRTRAAGVAIFGRRERGLELVASRGRLGSRVLVERAVAGGIAVGGPGDDTERAIAVPIHHARAVVGAILCRWTADAEIVVDRVQPLVAAAAAALGPTLKLTCEEPPAETAEAGIPELVGSSAIMVRLREAIGRAAAAPFPVLIEGESGSGKELVARAIHARSDRRHRKFCAINCAALTDELLEAELFGHAKGAFTGATAERRGLFEEADGGVLLLDEVSELSPRAQAKLLRAVQEREIRRVGENFPRPVDVRVLGASNRPLRTEAAGGRFRQDLLYRLDVVRIVVPPLRERVEDIPVLASRFWTRSAERVKSRASLGSGALAALASHAWPGNVRELQNVIAALAVKAPRHGRIGSAAVSGLLASSGLLSPGAPAGRQLRLVEARREMEERLVRTALARSGGHRGRAAVELGVTRQGLAKLMTRLGIGKVSSLN